MELQAKQAASLAFLNDQDRAAFLAAVNDPQLPQHRKEIVVSIAGQFHKWGKLTEKQVRIFLDMTKKASSFEEWKQQRAEKVAHLAPVQVDEIVIVGGKVTKIEENVPCSMGVTTKYVVEGVCGTRYNIKTTSKKLGPVFRAAHEAKTTLKFQGKVIWMTPDRVIVCLHPKSIKLI